LGLYYYVDFRVALENFGHYTMMSNRHIYLSLYQHEAGFARASWVAVYVVADRIRENELLRGRYV